MSHNWSDVFIGVEGRSIPDPVDVELEKRGGWLAQLRDGLSKSRKALQQQFASVMFDRATAATSSCAPDGKTITRTAPALPVRSGGGFVAHVSVCG